MTGVGVGCDAATTTVEDFVVQGEGGTMSGSRRSGWLTRSDGKAAAEEPLCTLLDCEGYELLIKGAVGRLAIVAGSLRNCDAVMPGSNKTGWTRSDGRADAAAELVGDFPYCDG
jgi:hypothetical protein